jgi:hypothetical protein
VVDKIDNVVAVKESLTVSDNNLSAEVDEITVNQETSKIVGDDSAGAAVAVPTDDISKEDVCQPVLPEEVVQCADEVHLLDASGVKESVAEGNADESVETGGADVVSGQKYEVQIVPGQRDLSSDEVDNETEQHRVQADLTTQIETSTPAPFLIEQHEQQNTHIDIISNSSTSTLSIRPAPQEHEEINFNRKRPEKYSTKKIKAKESLMSRLIAALKFGCMSRNVIRTID